MAKLESIIKQVVARVARREVRAAILPLSREVRRLRAASAQMKRSLKALEGEAARAKKGAEPGAVPRASEEDAQSARIGSRWVKTLRRKINVSQSELASLLGISTSAVRTWEYGISKPRGANRMTLVSLRGMGRREVKKLLEAKGSAGSSDDRGEDRPAARRSKPRKSSRSAKTHGRAKAARPRKRTK